VPVFNHLHVHTQFSLLDGAANISAMYKKAVEDKMRAIAITDHGNMFGVFKFVAEAGRYNTADNPNTIKPIVGCEFYVVENCHKKHFTKEDKDIRYHQLMLAKNAEGYHNLAKLCSLGYIEGLYGKYPRIDKELILKYHKGLIATTCCLAAEVPRTIIRKGEDEAEKIFRWWLDLFGEDYYVELQRHNIPEQNKVNLTLLKFAAKYGVKIICSNDSHYINQADSNAHDILLCINTGEKQSTPKAKEIDDDDASQKGKRFAFYNDQFYFKTNKEMSVIFSDLPEALDNTNEIVDKVETLKLKKDILLPHFEIPDGFTSQDDYLKHLTYEGAYSRYSNLTSDIEERINFELFTIRTMGFAGYFLIVADFIKAGKEIGVLVGPGRGSAAGSVVAYCIGITNIDPIKYNLLFERFLNPERKSMPDIDTDFDDEGRQKVIDYVVGKYGRNQVAQIITHGTMAAKMSIKDVARVLDLPLSESNALAKLVPERPGIELNRVLTAPYEGEKSLKEKEGLGPEEIESAKKLRKVMAGNDLQAKVLQEAIVLEGSVRNTGIHAAGIIIAPKDLTEIIPVCTSKESELLITQFEGKVIEEAGVLKMDFLGLKTLTIIRDALDRIKENHGVTIDIDAIPLDDIKTFRLYQLGATNGTFQFESAGMQKYLRELKPDKFEDLIAMNALFRPGPMEYIPAYIRRKHGLEKVTYDLPEMEEYLKETYGVTVYQEQVMLLSQKLAKFSKGDADVLRKAMGKKDKATLDKMKNKFREGCAGNKLNLKICEKIWGDWEKFAQYAFNKSHSTCYAFVAFQTAYLKAHYPAEYMASVLTNHLNNLDKVTSFMEECKKMGIKVLGPDINKSYFKFTVTGEKEIRFGLGAIKGLGEAPVRAIIEERKTSGTFSGIYNITQRINGRMMTKKNLELLVLAGALDCFEDIHRAQYFTPANRDETITVIEHALRLGGNAANPAAASMNSLFDNIEIKEDHAPKIPNAEPWSVLEKLHKEKEVTGIYISGHPMDEFRLETQNFCTCRLDEVELQKNKKVAVAGIVTSVSHRLTKTGKPFGIFTLEDYYGSYSPALFSEDYLKFKHFLVEGQMLFIRGHYQTRYNSQDQYELKISGIQLLQDVCNNLTKDVTLILSMEGVTDKSIQDLNHVIHNYPGRLPLFIQVNDDNEHISLKFQSKRSVSLSQDLIQYLARFEGVELKLN